MQYEDITEQAYRGAAAAPVLRNALAGGEVDDILQEVRSRTAPSKNAVGAARQESNKSETKVSVGPFVTGVHFPSELPANMPLNSTTLTSYADACKLGNAVMDVVFAKKNCGWFATPSPAKFTLDVTARIDREACQAKLRFYTLPTRVGSNRGLAVEFMRDFGDSIAFMRLFDVISCELRARNLVAASTPMSESTVASGSPMSPLSPSEFLQVPEADLPVEFAWTDEELAAGLRVAGAAPEGPQLSVHAVHALEEGLTAAAVCPAAALRGPAAAREVVALVVRAAEILEALPAAQPAAPEGVAEACATMLYPLAAALRLTAVAEAPALGARVAKAAGSVPECAAAVLALSD